MALPASAQKYPLSSTAFRPTSIGGCALWLDGADPAGTGTPPSNGATVSTWVDKSSAKNATGTGTPTYLTGGGINFNGSSYFLNQTFTQNLSQRSIFIVMRETVRNNVFGVFPLIPTPSSGIDYNTTSGLTIETSNGLRFYGNEGGYLSDIGNTSLLVKAVYNDNMNGTAGSGYVNGTNATNVTAAYTATTCSGYAVAARWLGSISTTYALNGVIYEILFFNTPLNTTNRQLIEGYLAWKWGLQVSLPVGHPYKSVNSFGSTTSRYSATKGRAPTVFPLNTSLSAKVSKTGFNAQQIAGLQLWLDASDASTFTFTSGKISQWLDKSSNAFTATQANATYQPSIQAADLNKKNTVNFSTSYMPMTVGSACYPLDCYCVIALKDTTSNVDFIGSTAQFLDNFNSLTFSDYTTSRWQNGSTSQTRTPNTVSAMNETSTGYLIIRWSIVNGSYQLWRNGVLLSQTSSYTFTPTAGSLFSIGQRSTQYNTNLLKGYIAEIQVYTTQLPTAQQQIVEGNLAWKWGLQSSLLSTHPYSKFPPLSYVAPPTPAVIVTTNLVENLDAATYTSGSTWTALVGNNYAVSGTLTTTSTPGGSTAVVLDGSSYAQDSTGITATTLYNYTLDVWFYSAAGQTASIIGEGGQGNLGGWNVTVISITSNTVSVGFWIGGVYQLSVGSYTANTWTHVAYSYNNTTGAVVGYLNGQRTANGTATKQWPATIFYTTGGGMNPYGNFTGQLGAYKVYNAILTDTQVNQNFNALRGRFGV